MNSTLLPNEEIKSHLVTRLFLRGRARFPGFNCPRVQLVKLPEKNFSDWIRVSGFFMRIKWVGHNNLSGFLLINNDCVILGIESNGETDFNYIN